MFQQNEAGDSDGARPTRSRSGAGSYPSNSGQQFRQQRCRAFDRYRMFRSSVRMLPGFEPMGNGPH
jgi:hypothetical protein